MPPPNPSRLAASLLIPALLTGCSFTQPMVEVTARTAFTPLPVSLDQLEARRECREHTALMHGQTDEAERTSALDQEVEAYQALVEEALVHRAETVRLVERLRAALDSGQAIQGQHLTALNESLATHLTLREALFRVARQHECWLDDNDGASSMSDGQRLKGIMISLSAALVLYDNYLLAISLYQEEPRLRMLLNNQDVGYGLDYGELNRVAMSFASEENRNRVRRGMAYYEEAIGHFHTQLQQDRHLFFLYQTISQSPSYSMTKRFSPLAYLGRKLDFYVPFTMETLQRLKSEGVGLSSMIFGNTVGLVESRRGKLYGREEISETLAGELQAGDILIERTPFRLTDTFIPGHWGHAAIWIGSEAELRALGIWEHAAVVPYQEAIRQGRGVAEALRPGVELNTLRHFLNVDDLAVLRPQRLPATERAQAILQALRQMGKRYDFNFDVETRDRVSCAELVYHAYGRLDWPTQKVLGRATITPDDIAVRALNEGGLEVVALYDDGTPARDALRQRLQSMMAPSPETDQDVTGGTAQ